MKKENAKPVTSPRNGAAHIKAQNQGGKSQKGTAIRGTDLRSGK